MQTKACAPKFRTPIRLSGRWIITTLLTSLFTISTSLAIRWQIGGMTIGEHLRIVDALALAAPGVEHVQAVSIVGIIGVQGQVHHCQAAPRSEESRVGTESRSRYSG